jgi:hypothetical protein
MRPGIVICSTYLPTAARVSGSGLPASGRAEITLKLATGKVCWDFTITKIDGAGNAAHIQRKPGLLALVDDKVGLKARSYFRKDAYIFGAFSSLDSE